jgi:hypothetical protein
VVVGKEDTNGLLRFVLFLLRGCTPPFPLRPSDRPYILLCIILQGSLAKGAERSAIHRAAESLEILGNSYSALRILMR